MFIDSVVSGNFLTPRGKSRKLRENCYGFGKYVLFTPSHLALKMTVKGLIKVVLCIFATCSLYRKPVRFNANRVICKSGHHCSPPAIHSTLPFVVQSNSSIILPLRYKSPPRDIEIIYCLHLKLNLNGSGV